MFTTRSLSLLPLLLPFLYRWYLSNHLSFKPYLNTLFMFFSHTQLFLDVPQFPPPHSEMMYKTMRPFVYSSPPPPTISKIYLNNSCVPYSLVYFLKYAHSNLNVFTSDKQRCWYHHLSCHHWVNTLPSYLYVYFLRVWVWGGPWPWGGGGALGHRRLNNLLFDVGWQ
jgi:hypothetical protein